MTFSHQLPMPRSGGAASGWNDHDMRPRKGPMAPLDSSGMEVALCPGDMSTLLRYWHRVRRVYPEIDYPFDLAVLYQHTLEAFWYA